MRSVMMLWTAVVLGVSASGCGPNNLELARPGYVDFQQRERDQQAAQDTRELAALKASHEEFWSRWGHQPSYWHDRPRGTKQAVQRAMERCEPFVGMTGAEVTWMMGGRPASADAHTTITTSGRHEQWVYIVRHYDDSYVPHHWHTLYVYLDNDIVTAYQVEPQEP